MGEVEEVIRGRSERTGESWEKRMTFYSRAFASVSSDQNRKKGPSPESVRSVWFAGRRDSLT